MPRIKIDLGKIEANSRLIAGMLAPHGVRLVGVTKACLGNQLIAQAILSGGAAALADSRLENVAGIRRLLPDAEVQLMRPAPGDKIDPPPALFFVSSAWQARAILDANPVPDHSDPEAALRFCLMIETGDGREGVPPDLAAGEAEALFEMEGAQLVGLATNAACARVGASLGGALKVFYEASSRVLWRLGRRGLEARRRQGASHDPAPYGKMRPFPVMSIGGSGFLKLLTEEAPDARAGGGGPFLSGSMSPLGPVTELRCGEAIMLGRIPDAGSADLFVARAHRDAFILEGEVLEVFERDGERQALLDFGLQDVGAAPLVPRQPGISLRSVTSDYLGVTCSNGPLAAPDSCSVEPRMGNDSDMGGQTGVAGMERTAAAGGPAGTVRPGGTLSFIPTYYALMAAMTSPFVEKVFVGE